MRQATNCNNILHQISHDNSLGIEGKTVLTLVIFEWLQTSGGNQPNQPNQPVYTYNRLLGAFKSDGHWEIAERIYHEMLQTGVSPDIVTQNTLINYEYNSERRGDVEVVLDIFGDFKQQCCREGEGNGTKKNENQIEATESRRYSEQKE
ncbi:hypothetical protein R1sor_011686 [Riccia sorocarpa]|uniref:Pentatricopeptide repeat-containing protein n=1 Tax=Riccia sorocarpa TaxID=122646 RepID=A0ABD3I5G7_9MARC